MECLAILYLLFTKSDSEDKILPSTIPNVTEQNVAKTSVLESKALPLNLPSQLWGSYIYWGPGWAGGILGNLGYERKSPRYTCRKEPGNGVSDEAGPSQAGTGVLTNCSGVEIWAIPNTGHFYRIWAYLCSLTSRALSSPLSFFLSLTWNPEVFSFKEV